jgi:hypothetical protein
MDVETYQNIH